MDSLILSSWKKATVVEAKGVLNKSGDGETSQE